MNGKTLGRFGVHLVLGAAAVLGPARAALAQAQPPAWTQALAPSVNFTSGAGYNRTTLTYIVIHKTEGATAAGAVSWFQNPASHVSAHFVVDKNGDIYESVKPEDVAWHAGNWDYNVHSIGIEHAGFT